MKTKLLIFLVLINSMFIINCNCVQAQNTPSDKQAIAMLRGFYTAYITEWSKLTTPVDLTKLDAIQKKYCTANLLNKINAEYKRGYVGSDPFVAAQDVDISWLKIMSFSKDLKKSNGYIMSYVIDSVSNRRVVIHLTVIKQGNSFKISSIR